MQRRHFQVGDLVRFDSPMLPHNESTGIVVDKIHYIQETHYLEMPAHGHLSEDMLHNEEYSCCVLLLGTSEQVMARSKWLKLVSPVKNI